jgi:hypothetical protein
MGGPILLYTYTTMKHRVFAAPRALLTLVVAVSACSEGSNQDGPAAPAAVVRNESLAQRSNRSITVEFYKANGSTFGPPVTVDQKASVPQVTREQIKAMREELESVRQRLPDRDWRRALKLLEALERFEQDPTALRVVLLGRDKVRISHEKSGTSLHVRASNDRGRLFDLVDSRGRSMGLQSLMADCDPTMLIVDDCGDYDPNWDPTPVIQDVAAMQAEVATADASITAAESAVLQSAPFYDACRPERFAYNAAIAAFVITSGSVLVFAIARQPGKTVAAVGSWITVTFALNIKRAELERCLERVREASRGIPQ